MPSKNQPQVQKRYRERQKLKKIANARPIISPSKRFSCKPLALEFTECTKLVPNTNQSLFLYDVEDFGNHYFILVCGRKTGKTTSCAAVVIWHIFEIPKVLNRGLKVLIVTPFTKELFSQIKKIIDTTPEFAKEVLYPGLFEHQLSFKLRNGSEVQIVGAQERFVKGPTVDLVLVDESVLVSDKILNKIWGTISGDISRIILLSTPDAVSGKFIEIANNPAVYGFKKYQWSELDDCPWIPSDLIEGKRRNLPEGSFEWKTGVIGEVPKLEEKYIFRKLLPKCILPGITIKGGGRIIAGLDTVESGNRDRIGLIILEITPKEKRVIRSRPWEGQTMLEALPEIHAILKAENVSLLYVDLRPTESAKDVIAEVKDIPVIPVNFQGFKGQAIMNLRRNLQGPLKIFEDHKELIKEIDEYYPSRGKNDDLIDGLMIALWKDSNQQESKETKIINIKSSPPRWKHQEKESDENIEFKERVKELQEQYNRRKQQLRF
jgi:hypothetical protein